MVRYPQTLGQVVCVCVLHTYCSSSFLPLPQTFVFIMTQPHHMSDKINEHMLFVTVRPQVPLRDLMQPSVPPDALDLLQRLLVFNPDKRLTAEEALQHSYVAKYVMSEDFI